MLTEIKAILSRSQATIWQDLIGGAALMVSLMAALYLPVLF